MGFMSRLDSGFSRIERLLYSAGQYAGLIRIIILSTIFLAAFFTRLFSVLRYESIIHEFDPWFNFRATKYLVENGWYGFLNWFDERAWYPLGRPVGTTVFPGMMVTSAILHHITNKILAIPIDIRDVCVFLAPFFAGLTCIATYLLTKELQDGGAALLAASLMAVCPGYISRSVAGSYDYEGIAIFLMVATFYCWVKACKRGSVIWAASTAIMYYYMVSTWGGYVYVINLIPLHVFSMLIIGRYSPGLYRAYCTFYIIGTLASLTIPFVGYAPISSTEHLPARGIFCLIQVFATIDVINKVIDDKDDFWKILKMLIFSGSIIALTGVVGLSLCGFNVLGPWVGRFHSLFDTSYASKHTPIIASVSEHQPTPWGSYFFDMNILLAAAPVGLFLCFQGKRTEHVFAIMFALSAVYFSAVMVRLMLTLAPIMCILGGMGISRLLDIYLPGTPVSDFTSLAISSSPSLSSPSPSLSLSSSSSSVSMEHLNKSTVKSSNARPPLSIESRFAVIFSLLSLLAYYFVHSTWVASTSYSSPSIMVATYDNRTGGMRIIDDFREAYYWLRRNTPTDAKVMSWWDYGYQLSGMADRTTIVDNNTWNNTHIATVGLALALPEEKSYPVLRKLNTDYVLVLSGAISGFAGDDINKFLWMVRITSGVYPDQVNERAFLTNSHEYRVDGGATKTMKESLMYKMCYHGVNYFGNGPANPPFDRVRKIPLKDVNPKLSILEEAYTTDNHMMRIYKVKSPDVLGRSLFKIKSK